MRIRYINLIWLISIYLLFANSCSSGSDPEDIITEDFSVPLEYCLLINNGINDIIMDINAIAMNNLNTEKDTIDDEIAACVTPVIHRTGTVIDSIVIDYGNSSCKSNGGSFKGKVIVDPESTDLFNFEIRFKDFVANGFGVTGSLAFNVEGRIAARDFSISSSALSFSFTDSESNIRSFTISTFEADYFYLRSENDDIDYVDDIFKLTYDMDITDPNGAQMSLTSNSDLIYAYSCKNIIGGTSAFELQSIGKATVNYGGGDTTDDCDERVSVNLEGSTIAINL